MSQITKNHCLAGDASLGSPALIWRARLLVAVVVLFGTACSKVPSDLDEAALLESMSFNAPVVYSIQLDQITDDERQWTDNSQAHLAAPLVVTGYLSVIPNPNSAPWCNFSVDDGAMSGSQLTVTAGTRVITARSKPEKWSAGGVKYFAETITYSIDISDRLDPIVKANIDGQTLRLVAAKDPAVGSWQVTTDTERGTQYAQDDAATISQLVAATGRDSLSALSQAVAQAKQRAFDEIEADLASNGILVRVSDSPNVLVSDQRQLRYYRGDTIPLSSGVTLGSLKQRCADLGAENAAWRLPSADELATVFAREAVLIDTPDHRLWGDFGEVTPPSFYLLSSSAKKYISYTSSSHIFTTIAYQLEALGRQFKRQFKQVTLMPRGPDPDGAVITDGYGNKAFVKLLCVADLAGS